MLTAPNLETYLTKIVEAQTDFRTLILQRDPPGELVVVVSDPHGSVILTPKFRLEKLWLRDDTQE